MTDDPILAAAGSTHEAIELWQDDTRAWRWRYLDAAAGIELPSNRGYESRAGALEAARLAYPHVPVFERDSDPRAGSGGTAVLWIAMAVVMVAVLAVATVAIVLGSAALALGWRAIRLRVRALMRR